MSVPCIDSSAPRLLDQVREVIRIRHYSIRTEAASAHPCAPRHSHIHVQHKRTCSGSGASSFSTASVILATWPPGTYRVPQ